MPHHTKDTLLGLLADAGIQTRTVEHPAVFTVAESEAIHKHDLLPGGHVKNLFLKDKKGGLFLVTALHDAQIDLKKIHTLIGAAGRVSFGKPDLLMEVLGVAPGSVTPLAAINDTEGRVKVVLEAKAAACEALNPHPLINTATTHIATADLIAFLTAHGHAPEVVALDGGGAGEAG